MKSLAVAAVCFIACVAVSAAQTTFINCTGETTVGTVVVTKVYIPGCTTPPCRIKRGTNATVTFYFTPTQDFDDLFVKVDGKIAGILINFPLPQGDMCKLGTTCPIKAKVPNQASFTVVVKSSYPAITAPVYVFIDDTKSNKEGCFEVELTLM